jgi:hypothetical protein
MSTKNVLIVIALVIIVGIMVILSQVFIADMFIESKQQQALQEAIKIESPQSDAKSLKNVLIPPLTNIYVMKNGKAEQWFYYSYFLGRNFPHTTGAYTRKGIVLQTIENGQYAAVRMEKYDKLVHLFRTADLIPVD